MQDTLTEKKQVQNLIKAATNIAVIPSKMGEVDAFSSAVGLYYMLQKDIDSDSKDAPVKRAVSFVHTGPIPQECLHLISNQEIVSDIATRELLISIDYSDTSAEKVHWNHDAARSTLYLNVRPIEKDYDLRRVKAVLKGFGFDLIFTLGMQAYEDVSQMYAGLEDEFKTAKVINIDNTSLNARFGYINLVDTSAASLSLLVLQKAFDWGLTPDQKAGKALLTGIVSREL